MTMMKKQLLSRNLCMPKPRANALLRERLFQRLDAGLAHRVIGLYATAGSGKTTLLT